MILLHIHQHLHHMMNSLYKSSVSFRMYYIAYVYIYIYIDLEREMTKFRILCFSVKEKQERMLNKYSELTHVLN